MDARSQHNWWLTFSKFQTSREKTWSGVLFKNLTGQITPTIHAVEQHGIAYAISHLDTNVPMEALGRTIHNIYVDAGTVFGGKTYQMVKKQAQQKGMMPIGYNEELIRDIINYYRLYLLSKAVVPISETTKDYILQILIQAQQKGWSIQMVVDKLGATDITRNRARLIARTETNKSANWAAVWGAKKTGYDTNKIWISARDNRTRTLAASGPHEHDKFDHLNMNGVMVAMDEAFQVPKRGGGYEAMMQPGDPKGSAADVCRCRCCVGFKVNRDARGVPIRAGST